MTHGPRSGNKVKGDSLVREEDVKQLKDVLRFFVQKSEAGRDEDPKQREEVRGHVT